MQCTFAQCCRMFVCILVVVQTTEIRAQLSKSDDGVWEQVLPETKESLQLAARPDNRFRPRTFQLFRLDRVAFQRITNRTPRARIAIRALDGDNVPNGPELSLPKPQGGFQRFRMEETDVMAPELAAKFPEIKSYRGISEDGKSIVHADIGANGFHAQVIGPGGVELIDPWDAAGTYASYFKRESRFDRSTFSCGVRSQPGDARREAARPAVSSGSVLRTFRLAVGCTHQYAQKHGGTKSSVLAAMVTTINRVNLVYQRDLCIRLQLVANNDTIIFTDAMTDRFTGNDDADTLIDESQAVIDEKIGSTNYDIGHTFSTGAGGLAGLGVVCKTGNKARGVTGSSNPVGDPFDIDYVAHEMGHQFSGNHTFNGKIQSCAGGNRNGPTAAEPGSGSTIQAYAGICGADNVQPNSDPYFHAVSLDEMLTFINFGAANVVAGVPTGNTPPVVSAGSDCKIPKQTPFQLTATGSDPNGDAISYCWEQMDLGPASNLGVADNGSNPLFRSQPPSPASSRVFPAMSTLLSGTGDKSEILPLKSRTLTFRVTGRDNRLPGGGVGGDEVLVSVIPAAGPFKVTAPAGGSHAGVVEVKWDVAKTNLAPISTQFVNIVLSTDGGQSFTTTLASSTPNDGNQLVSLPSTLTSAARIKVEAVGNVFFNISKSFSINQASAVTIVVRHAEKANNTPDTPLSLAGERRAIGLRQELINSDVTEIRATRFLRTKQTAKPTAERIGVDIEEFSDVPELCTSLMGLTDGRTTLVVAHSDSVPEIVRTLKPGTSVSIAENQFDQMFVIVRRPDNLTTILQRKYLVSSTSAIARPETASRPLSDATPSTTELDLRQTIDLLRQEVKDLRDDLKRIEAKIPQ